MDFRQEPTSRKGGEKWGTPDSNHPPDLGHPPGAIAILALEGSALALYFQHIASKIR